MKFYIVFAIGLICSISSQIRADETVKKCGGNNTEVIIEIEGRLILGQDCHGQQIHKHAIIVPAYCIDGVNREKLRIVKGKKTQNVNFRNVSSIFIHPLYSRCSPNNDIAILLFFNAFNVEHDIICMEDPKVIHSDQHRECHSQSNILQLRVVQYRLNGMEYLTCSPRNDHVFLQTGKYMTGFETCLFHPNGSSEVIKSLYEYKVWGLNHTSNSIRANLIEIGYKLYDSKDWLDTVLQMIIPAYINLHKRNE